MYLCLDYGTRYIGLAATDYDGKITYRYGVIDQKQENALARLKEIVEQEKFTTLLVGVPVGLSGQETEQTKITRDFIEQLKLVLPAGIKVEEVDETLTSVEAAAQVDLEGGDKNMEHAQAALIMLESYLRNI